MKIINKIVEELSRVQKKYLAVDLDDYESIGREVDTKTNQIKLVCFN